MWRCCDSNEGVVKDRVRAFVVITLHPPRASHLTGDKRQEEVQDCGQRHKTDGVPGGRASPTRLFILRRT